MSRRGRFLRRSVGPSSTTTRRELERRAGDNDDRTECAMSIIYLRGDATAPVGEGERIICHVCNDSGGWGKGFVLALSRRWAQPEEQYRAWYSERSQNDFGLGAVQFVQVEPTIWVANMIGQHGIKRGSSGPPIRYEAVALCLQQVAGKAAE